MLLFSKIIQERLGKKEDTNTAAPVSSPILLQCAGASVSTYNTAACFLKRLTLLLQTPVHFHLPHA